MINNLMVAMTRIILLAMLAAPFGFAQAAEDDDRWEIVLAPYLWGVSLDGKVGIDPLPPVNVDASLSDLLDYLNFALSVHTEFKKGKWNFVIDPTYFNLETDAPTQTLPSPPPLGNTVTVGGKIEVEMWIVEGWASYLVAPGWELLGGVRWQSQDISPTLVVDGTPNAVPGVDESWADLFAGVRWQKALGQKWMVSLRGDVGFAGDSEAGSLNGIAMFNRRFGKSMALNLGYRYFKNEYKNTGEFDWDMVMSGPIIGYTWQFGKVSWPN
jgi:hypothetical protein